MATFVPKLTKQHNLNSLFKFDLAVLSALSGANFVSLSVAMRLLAISFSILLREKVMAKDATGN